MNKIVEIDSIEYIRAGRFYYQPVYLEGNDWHEKPKEFLAFATTLFKRTKKFLNIVRSERGVVSYCGNEMLERFDRNPGSFR